MLNQNGQLLNKDQAVEPETSGLLLWALSSRSDY
jgi:hypothetical protein